MKLRFLILFLIPLVARSEELGLVAPAYRLRAGDPAWLGTAAQFSKHPDLTAGFDELRYFPFRKDPVKLKGEVRVSADHGLSLHYLPPDERIVLLDDAGVLIREPSGQSSAPSDPHLAAVNKALLHILRFDLDGLSEGFDLYGRRDADTWTLALVPHDRLLLQAFSRIEVAGDATSVRRIELVHSAHKHVTIEIGPPLPSRPFSVREMQTYFR